MGEGEELSLLRVVCGVLQQAEGEGEVVRFEYEGEEGWLREAW